MPTVTAVDDLLRSLHAWAVAQPDILGILLVGSHARGDARGDSDIDLVIVAINPVNYLDDILWASEFGAVSQSQIEPYGKVTSLRVTYVNGMEVEFGLTDPSWAAEPMDAGTREVVRAGARIVYDRGHRLSGLIATA